jgi:hypothetical protein
METTGKLTKEVLQAMFDPIFGFLKIVVQIHGSEYICW